MAQDNVMSYLQNMYTGAPSASIPKRDTGYSLQGGMDWIGNNSDALNTGMGLAGMGLNAYSTLFGQGKNAYNKNMTLLDQQIAGNKEKLGRRDALNTAWANTEKVQPKPQGLASSGQGYL